MNQQDIIRMAREAGLHRQQHNLASNPVQYRFSYDGYEENLERFAALVAAAEREACAKAVEAEHQAFIDSLPTDSDDKMYMQIHHWARQSYKRHQSLVRGQMITAADASDTHIIWAALRWAKENAPPAAQPAPVQEPIGYLFQHEEIGRTTFVDVQQVEWGFEKNNPRYQKIGPVYTTPPAAQRQWVGLTQDEFRDFASTFEYGTGGLIRAIEAKLKEKNT